MGNSFTTVIHYPSEMIEISDKFKIIPIMMSMNRASIYDNLKETTNDLIIMLCSNELAPFNYSELASRLSHQTKTGNRNIIVCIKINSTEKKNPLTLSMDQMKYETAILNILRNLKNDFMIKYMKKLLIEKITICMHNSSYNKCIDRLAEKYRIIMIDPIINTNLHYSDQINSNLYVMLSSDYPDIVKVSECLKKITKYIYVLSDMTSNNIYNLSISNLREINEKSVYWNLVGKTIMNIISISFKNDT